MVMSRGTDVSVYEYDIVLAAPGDLRDSLSLARSLSIGCAAARV